MDTLTYVLIAAVAVALIAAVTLIIISRHVSKKQMKKDEELARDIHRPEGAREAVPENEEELEGSDENIVPVLTEYVAFDAAISPLFANAAFVSYEVKGKKIPDFDTVAAVDVSRMILEEWEQTGFDIMYSGAFQGDTIRYKFYYLRIRNPEEEGGFVVYIIYESCVGAFAIEVDLPYPEIKADLCHLTDIND